MWVFIYSKVNKKCRGKDMRHSFQIHCKHKMPKMFLLLFLLCGSKLGSKFRNVFESVESLTCPLPALTAGTSIASMCSRLFSAIKGANHELAVSSYTVRDRTEMSSVIHPSITVSKPLVQLQVIQRKLCVSRVRSVTIIIILCYTFILMGRAGTVAV